jgi:hypothetical protein
MIMSSKRLANSHSGLCGEMTARVGRRRCGLEMILGKPSKVRTVSPGAVTLYRRSHNGRLADTCPVATPLDRLLELTIARLNSQKRTESLRTSSSPFPRCQLPLLATSSTSLARPTFVSSKPRPIPMAGLGTNTMCAEYLNLYKGI